MNKTANETVNKKRPRSITKKINRFIAACANKFSNDKDGDPIDPFFDMVIGQEIYQNDPFVIDDIDLMLKTKGNADKFFSFFTNSDLIWYDHHLSHWGTQTQKRYDNWNKICEKINGYCMKYYGCKWGSQKVNYEEKIPPFAPLKQVSCIGDFKENMINRPLYKGNTLIGYIKGITWVSIITGYHSEYDDADGDYYPNVPEYTDWHMSILLYGSPKRYSNINYYEKDGKTYILGNTLDKYTVLEDKVVLNVK